MTASEKGLCLQPCMGDVLAVAGIIFSQQCSTAFSMHATIEPNRMSAAKSHAKNMYYGLLLVIAALAACIQRKLLTTVSDLITEPTTEPPPVRLTDRISVLPIKAVIRQREFESNFPVIRMQFVARGFIHQN